MADSNNVAVGETASSEDFFPPLFGPQSRQIRLIEMLPGSQEGSIACQYHMVSLDDEPSYEVLSYAWGDSSITRPITVNQHSFEVTLNLEKALQHLQGQLQGRLLWIDAICINQSDNAEKTHQVNMMGEIYRRASQCIVWLGDFRDDGFTASDVGDAFGVIKLFSENASYGEMPREAVETLSRTSRTAFLALTAMVNTAWWRRIWTVQEVILPTKTRVMWGSKMIWWESLELAASAILEQWEKLPKSLRDQPLWHLVERNAFTRSLRGVTIARREVGSATRLLRRFRYREAEDPRDKVFGLLGVLQDGDFTSRVPTDYAMDTVEVYRRVALALFKSDKSFLSLVGRRGERPDGLLLPSWVPHWTQPSNGKDRTDRFYLNWFRWHGYDCSNGLEMEVREGVSTSEIEIDGFQIDTIMLTGEPMMQDEAANFSRRALWRSIRAWHELAASYQPADHPYIGGGTWFDACWRTMIGDVICSNIGGVPERWATKEDHRYFQTFLSSENGLAGNAGFDSAIDQMALNQCLFITRQGYVGIAPQGAQIGDEVWIILGNRLPFVLRPYSLQNAGLDVDSDVDPEPIAVEERSSEARYSLLGDCYVHGIMKGEAMSGYEENVRTIILQ